VSCQILGDNKVLQGIVGVDGPYSFNNLKVQNHSLSCIHPLNFSVIQPQLAPCLVVLRLIQIKQILSFCLLYIISACGTIDLVI